MTSMNLTELLYVIKRSARSCLLYTSDAADERSSVDLGGRRIIKKKINIEYDSIGRIKVKNIKTKEYRKKI